ncbi:paraquat-inducible protein A [Endozoicomonas sp. G2_1]|uniref:paraquat-inducible protein A n=1 Tax=Endozoicomonas sp. G2_1 TaxID=2821091 RepID=UPI001ADA2348|nr:paraquat-inducible protein A [Endozoicomonas sp. G2_1]MBO9490164.1 paraquat-inducible protein A [Endozoicomonas sp. G2_1]
MNKVLADQKLHCHECAQTVTLTPLAHKQKAHCPRCDLKLTSYHQYAIDIIIACALTALIFLAAAIPFNFLGFNARGQEQSMDLLLSVSTLIEHDFFLLALLQLLAIFAIPLIVLLGLLYLLLPLKLFNKPPAASAKVFNVVNALIPWSMAEIFLIGTLVSLVKLTAMADIQFGISFYAYVLFALFMTITLAYVDNHQLKQALGLNTKAKPPSQHSIQHTWALLITALILYIPASFLPIMNTRLLGQDDPNTIMGGVVTLWQHGDYPIAMVIFIASVFIPIAKLAILIWLNITVQKGHDTLHKERIVLYRITEFIGRWSMIDVFVVAILVSLIQLGNTMSIYPGPAALAFSGVVITTMLAANTFDSTLIWSNSHNKQQ